MCDISCVQAVERGYVLMEGEREDQPVAQGKGVKQCEGRGDESRVGED